MAKPTQVECGDNDVVIRWTEDGPVVVSVTPHFEGADRPTDEEIIEAVIENEADRLAALLLGDL